MARLKDWINLGKTTLQSLRTSDMANLYAQEWPETKRLLIAEHSESIEKECGRVGRVVRTNSAVMYGLAKRLAPHRRVIFVVAWTWFLFCIFNIFASMENPHLWIFVETVATFLMVTLLLAMELMDKIKFRDELALARDLQASLIPATPKSTAEYDVAAFNAIANTVGGDIYDFVPLPDGRLAILFGDASGHGMAAGLVMAVAHAAFRTQLEADPSPAAVVGTLNRILCRTGGTRSFFASCYLLLSPNGDFQITLAGHPQALKIGRDGKIIERIGRGAYPLGVKATVEWVAETGNLANGERLLLHSDGLTEARNVAGREFGEGYLEAIAGWHPEASVANLVETVVNELKFFCGSLAADDDVSIAVIEKRMVSAA